MLPDVNSYFTFLCGTDNWAGLSPGELRRSAENTLRNGGLTDEQIGKIKARILEP